MGGGEFNPIGYWRKFTFSQIWQNLELGKVVDDPALTYTDVPPFGSLQMEGVKCVAAQFVLGVHSLVNLVGIILVFFFTSLVLIL